jgi:hypothetical protein
MLPPLSMESWTATKKLYTSVALTPVPVGVPTQRPLVPSFTLVVGYAENFSSFPVLPPMSMEPWAAIKKALNLCGGDTSSFLGPYSTAACPEFHIGCRLR